MPENYEPGTPAGSDVAFGDESTVETARHEATDLADTTIAQAKDVAGTITNEASAVLGEAKNQAKDLYAQTKSELAEQANTQQQRLAAGLQSASAELEDMSVSSANPGVASEVIGAISGRLSGAAAWLGDRDPAGVLSEVSRYARRKPGTFLLVAAVAGVVAGRLTRALAANASDARASADATPTATVPVTADHAPAPAFAVRDEETPVFAQSAAARGEGFSEGDGHGRSDTV